VQAARRAVRLVAAMLVLGGAGFVVFLAARAAVRAELPGADGAAVLTGGAGRVDAGLALLASGHVRMLLISGVHPDVTLPDLARAAAPDARITLGRDARSTRGNAREIAAWAAANRLSSVIAVTHRLHMRRAVIEIGRAAPGLVVVPMPLPDPEGAMLLRRAAPEYLKLLGTMAGISALLPERETTP